MSIYKHVFWDVSGVPTPVSTTDTTELRNIASRVQTDYSTDVIFGLFDTGTDGNSARLSFVIIVKKKTSDEVNTIIDKLHKDIKDRLDADTAFQNAGYTVDAILKVEARVHFFDDKQDAYVQGYQESYSLEKALALHKTFESRCAPRAASNLHLPIRGTEAFQVSADQSGQAFSISSSKFTALQSATKDDLQADIAELQKAFSDLSEETKGPVAAVIMATKGFVTIGKEMWDKYKDIIKTKTSDSDIIDLTPELLIGIISAAGVGTVIAAIAGLAAAIGVAAVVFKDDVNLMLLVNGQQNQLTLVDAYVKNGETGVVCPSLDPAPDSNMELVAYPCGFYMYRKARLFGVAVGFYGSTVGVVFQSGNSDFSIGLDCPNTVIGGNNAIRPFAVTSGTGTADAAQAAADNTDGTGQSGESITVNGGTCTVVRAHEWGNVNYALCSLTA